MNYEITVNSLIKDKLIVQNEIFSQKLTKFATMLRIPRLHFEYIEKHGINEFIEYCEDIVRKERSIHENSTLQEK